MLTLNSMKSADGLRLGPSRRCVAAMNRETYFSVKFVT